jgi:hypothetical protein
MDFIEHDTIDHISILITGRGRMITGISNCVVFAKEIIGGQLCCNKFT